MGYCRCRPHWNSGGLTSRSQAESWNQKLLRNPSDSRNPEGPSTQYLRTLVSKNHTLSCIWDQSPEILGTWTLWVLVQEVRLEDQIHSGFKELIP